jgi:hypothetical protein
MDTYSSLSLSVNPFQCPKRSFACDDGNEIER